MSLRRNSLAYVLVQGVQKPIGHVIRNVGCIQFLTDDILIFHQFRTGSFFAKIDLSIEFSYYPNFSVTILPGSDSYRLN